MAEALAAAAHRRAALHCLNSVPACTAFLTSCTLWLSLPLYCVPEHLYCLPLQVRGRCSQGSRAGHPAGHHHLHLSQLALHPLPYSALVCRYVVLAPKGVEQATLLATTAADKKLGDLPAYQALLKKFTGKEVRGWLLFDEKHLFHWPHL